MNTSYLPKPTQQTIRLAVRDGIPDEYTHAYIYSGLALFRIQYGWNITHVNSGIRLLEVIGNKVSSFISTLYSPVQLPVLVQFRILRNTSSYAR